MPLSSDVEILTITPRLSSKWRQFNSQPSRMKKLSTCTPNFWPVFRVRSSWSGTRKIELESLRIALTQNASFVKCWGTCGQTSFNLFLISSVSWYVRHYIAHHKSILTACVRRNGVSMPLTCRILPGVRLVHSLSFPSTPLVCTVTRISRRFTTTLSPHIHPLLV